MSRCNSFTSAFGASGGGADATKLPLAGGTLTGQLIQSTNGAASTPPLLLNGTIFTGGTGTTTRPQFLVEPSGTTSTAWNTAGTMAGVNAPSGFTGYLFDSQLNGATKCSIGYTGTIITQGNVVAASGSVRGGNIYLNSTSNIVELYNDSCAILIGAGVSTADLRRGGAYCLQLGTDAAGVSSQHFKACNRITSDGVGANLTISGGNGRGGAGGSLILSYYTTAAAATAGTLTTALTINTLGEIIPVLPTSSAGLTTGALWNNLGIVTVA